MSDINQNPDGKVGFVLIHGTWSGRSAFGWPEKSPLVRRLKAEPWADKLDIIRFPWSGRNTHSARHKAGLELAEFINREGQARQWEQVILVCHSHAGNVAHVASERIELPHHLLCFATPFLVVRNKLPWIVGASIWATLWLAPYAAIFFYSYKIRMHFLDLWVQIVTAVIMVAAMANFLTNLAGTRSFVRWNPISMLQKWESKSVETFRELFPRRTTFISQLAIYSKLDEAMGIFRSSWVVSLVVANLTAALGLWILRDQFLPNILFDFRYMTQPGDSQREIPTLWQYFAPVAMPVAAVVGFGILIYDLSRVAFVAMLLSLTATGIQWLLRCLTIGYEPLAASLLLEIKGHATHTDARAESFCTDEDNASPWHLLADRIGFAHNRILYRESSLNRAVKWCRNIVESNGFPPYTE